MSKDKTIIIGAGLAGLSAAFHLGKDYAIYEKESLPGGICRSKKINGFTFDFGGHLLHTQKAYTENLVKSLLNENVISQSRNSWIYSFKKFTRYPFQIHTFGLPESIQRECVFEFIKAKFKDQCKKAEQIDFNRWVYSNFGKGIAKNFLIPYNKKFWTVHPKELSCDWINGFIPIPKISDVVRGALEDCSKVTGYNAKFLYPTKGGINSLIEAFSRNAGKINLNMELVKIHPEEKVIEFKNGIRCGYDKLILSVPLIELRDIMQDKMPYDVGLAFKKLRFNSIFNLNLGIEGRDATGAHWIYFPEKKFVFFRAGFFSNFSTKMVPDNCYSMYTEVSYTKASPIDKKLIVGRIIKDLYRAGLILKKSRVLVRNIADIKYGYVIYDKHYKSATSKIMNYLRNKGIFMIGRYGRWKYMTMEDAILDGRRVAEQIR